jgi:hypothetical protein
MDLEPFVGFRELPVMCEPRRVDAREAFHSRKRVSKLTPTKRRACHFRSTRIFLWDGSARVAQLLLKNALL